MSRATELAFEEARKSRIRFIKGNIVEIQDAVMLWPDFTGKPTKYNKEGDRRSFNLVLNGEILAFLQDLQQQTGAAFRIKQAKVYSDNDVEVKGVEQQYINYINVKVNIDSQVPPIIKLFTTYNDKRYSNFLDPKDFGQIDSMDIQSCDMEINCYSSKASPDKCSMYLRKLNIITTPESSEFGGKYDDWSTEPGEEVLTACDINPATGEKYQ